MKHSLTMLKKWVIEVRQRISVTHFPIRRFSVSSFFQTVVKRRINSLEVVCQKRQSPALILNQEIKKLLAGIRSALPDDGVLIIGTAFERVASPQIRKSHILSVFGFKVGEVKQKCAVTAMSSVSDE